MKEDVKKKLQGGKLWLPLSIIAAAVLILAVFITLFVLSRREFKDGVSISGIDCSGLSAEEAAGRLDAAIDSRELRLCDEEGTLLAVCSLRELTGETDTLAGVQALLRRQAKEKGLFGRGGTYFLPLDAEVSEEKLEGLLCGGDYVPHEPEDAYFVLDGEGPRIVPATRGNIPDLPRCRAAVEEALRGELSLSGEADREISIEGALIPAEIQADDPLLRSRLQCLRRFTEQDISIDFCGGRQYAMTVSDIVRSLDVEYKERGTVVRIDTEALSEVLREAAKSIDADGVMAKYGNVVPTREFVYLPQSDRGFQVNYEKLSGDVAALLQGCRGGSAAADYDYTWWLRRVYGWMGNVDTCVEISMDNQYLWLYVDGKLVTETPVTTGDIATGASSHRGAFRVSYKVADTILRGPTWNDHVDYWIPFDGDIGLHDSSWRSEYGGDVYLENGSHGCINTPHEPMGKVFEAAYVGMVVIVR